MGLVCRFEEKKKKNKKRREHREQMESRVTVTQY